VIKSNSAEETFLASETLREERRREEGRKKFMMTIEDLFCFYSS
jgi:hypothetical protein